jgi:hypothetical protein
LKIAIEGVRPQIWRRIVVPEAIGLSRLHEIFQITMGWLECHLHAFEARGVCYEIDYGDFFDESKPMDELEARLDMLVERSGDRFTYSYDFGDDWEHSVVLERYFPLGAFPYVPICLDGANAAPPEDCGGAYGYRELRQILRNPKHRQYADMRRWAGRGFDPLLFDIGDLNKRLAAYSKKGRLTTPMLIRGRIK